MPISKCNRKIMKAVINGYSAPKPNTKPSLYISATEKDSGTTNPNSKRNAPITAGLLWYPEMKSPGTCICRHNSKKQSQASSS